MFAHLDFRVKDIAFRVPDLWFRGPNNKIQVAGLRHHGLRVG